MTRKNPPPDDPPQLRFLLVAMDYQATNQEFETVKKVLAALPGIQAATDKVDDPIEWFAQQRREAAKLKALYDKLYDKARPV